MNALNRFVPTILAAFALLGCLLPFGGGNSGSLLSLPGALGQASSAIGAMGFLSGPPGAGPPAADPSSAVWIARLVYLAPLASILIIVQNFRGAVMRTMQIAAAIVWLTAVLIIPTVAGQALVASNPMLKGLAQMTGETGSFSLSFGIGGWLIVLAAIGMGLSAFGLLKHLQPKPSV